MTTGIKEDLTPVEELSYGSLDVTPFDFDFGTGWTDTWEFYAVPTCGSCGTDERVRMVDGEWRCYHRDRDHEWGEVVEPSGDDGPMMNYAYPIDEYVVRRAGGPDKVAEKLAGLPLCLVYFTELRQDYALALTGGGMDLSWEICEAFMRLGELPPTHFAELPGMAGMPRTDTDRWVVRGCIRSLQAAAERAQNVAERGVERMRAWLPGEEVEVEEEPTYRIVRRYQRDDVEPEVIDTGLTLEEAKAHCSNPETSSSTATHALARERTAEKGEWFDTFEAEED